MQIKAEPVWSYLIDADEKIIDIINDTLSIYKPGAQHSYLFQTGKWDGKEYLFNRRLNRFPTGLLQRVIDKIGYCPIIDDRYDLPFKKYICPSDLLKGITLVDFQIDIVEKMCSKQRGRGFLAPNSGKSAIIIAASELLQKKSLWFVDKLDLLYQALDMYKQYTGKEAGIIGDGKFDIEHNVVVGMVPTLYAASKKKLLPVLNQFEVIFVDEADALRSKSWFGVAMSCPAKYRFALTGSPPKDKYTAYKMAGATDIEILANRTNKENIEAGWSAKPLIYLQQLKYQDNNLSYSRAYDLMIRFNKRYASIVADEIYSWYKQGKKVLVLVEKVAQGANILSELRGRGIKSIYLQGDDESDYRHETLENFRQGKLDILIGTRILARGVDLPAINVLILAAGGKSQGQQIQRLGRSLRAKKDTENTVIIIDFLHSGNYYLLKHGIERAKLYEREGFEIIWRPDKIAMS